MNFHILTLFPDMVMQGLSTSIIGRAKDRGLLSIEAVNIRDYTLERHKKVDDYPYGGGAGMLMQAQPVYDAWKSVVDRIGYKPRTVYLTPQAPTKPLKTHCNLQLRTSGLKQSRPTAIISQPN